MNNNKSNNERRLKGAMLEGYKLGKTMAKVNKDRRLKGLRLLRADEDIAEILEYEKRLQEDAELKKKNNDFFKKYL